MRHINLKTIYKHILEASDAPEEQDDTQDMVEPDVPEVDLSTVDDFISSFTKSPYRKRMLQFRDRSSRLEVLKHMANMMNMPKTEYVRLFGSKD